MKQLVSNNNGQTTINTDLIQKLNDITDSLNNVTSVDALNHHSLSTEIDLIRVVINLDIIQDEIESIQNAIMLSKLDLINNRILNPSEIKMISSSLEDQGISSHLMGKALNFVSTASITNGEVIMYIVSIPNFSKTSFQLLHVEAIVHNAEQIAIPGKLYLMKNETLFLQTGPCKNLSSWTICKTTDIKDISADLCLSKVIRGKSGECSYEIVARHLPVLEMGPTTLLINDANGTLSNTCEFFICKQRCSSSGTYNIHTHG
ncbi:uncharacterized protein LOC129726142 [Wyeomyia smithii]|uniref:uncharacterized protein LOC129726142 n=1 Tax=Wyeomyia smithii TaxID=174621 RepID=UPI002467CF54|nr:uncharacterized protein LOC129726142 [Wyeomyia smithii]